MQLESHPDLELAKNFQSIYRKTRNMKLQVTPRQLLMLLEQDILKEHPITISGKSAKLLNRYMRQNNIKLNK